MERFMQPLESLLDSKPPQSVRSISATMAKDLWDTPNDLRLEDRHRRRTLFKTCGVDILWFGTAREMFHAVAGAVVGQRYLVFFNSPFLRFLLSHQNAYEKRLILHGDISDGNTMMLVDNISEDTAVPPRPDNAAPVWTPLRHGMTSDWGSAADCREKKDNERLPRTVSSHVPYW